MVNQLKTCLAREMNGLTPHLAETQATVSPVPARELPIHALLVLHLQLIVHLLIFPPCRGDTSNSRHTQPVQAYPCVDRSVQRMCGGDAGLIALGISTRQQRDSSLDVVLHTSRT